MKNNPLVTCIIPTYNKFKYIYDAIDSVLNQEYENIEIIITDDASQDFDSNKVRNYIELNMKENIVNVEININPINIGTVRNMNSALHISHGDIIMPLSCDDLFFNSKVISMVVDRFVTTGCNILSCRRLKCREEDMLPIRYMPDSSYLNIINKKLNNPEKMYKAFGTGDSLEVASGSSSYYRFDFIEKNGFYNEKYCLWEDGPFYAKLTREGYVIDTAFDIVSIKYRDGGISTLKNSANRVLNKITMDYINMLDIEYIPYFNRFSIFEKRIIRARVAILKRNGNSVKNVIMYPDAMAHIYWNKVYRRLLILYSGLKKYLK
ncbi:glycosyltransferase family 2 protein [Desulfosporosinus fructosivorans]